MDAHDWSRVLGVVGASAALGMFAAAAQAKPVGGYTPASFDGTYKISGSSTTSITCPKTTPPMPHIPTRTTRISQTVHVVGGKYGGRPIVMFGTLGRGSVKWVKVAGGITLTSLTTFTLTPSGTVFFLSTLNSSGPFARVCTEHGYGVTRGQRVSK